MKIISSKMSPMIIGTLAVLTPAAVIIGVLMYLLPELSQGNQALVLASVLGALGTITLALATFSNVLQTSRTLELRERERREPLAVDEISYFLEPAITALEKNISDLSNPRYGGCAYEWVYLDESKLSTDSRAPIPVQYANTLDLARFKDENPEVYELLQAHDQQILDIAKEAQRFHEQVTPKVRELLIQEDLEEYVGEYMKVLTSSMLMEVDHFGENHALYEFWEEYGTELIQHAREHPETTLEDIKNLEGDLQELCEDTIEQTRQWKHLLQEKYGISDEDLHDIQRPLEVM